MLPKETALSKLAKTTVKPVTVKPPTKTTSSPTTTIPYDEWSKQIEKLKAAATTTTTPTTVPKVAALPKGYKPIGSQPAPEGTIGIDTKGNFFLGTGKVVRKENFKPGSSSVMYNPGPRVKATTPKSPTPPVTVPKAYPELTTTQTPEEKTQDAIDASREAQAGATNLGITETQKKPGGWRGALASAINFDIIPGKREFKPVENLVIRPLIVLDTGRRAAVSGFQESIEFAKDFKEGKQVYTSSDYIPTHPQTGKPIARIGDPIIDNVDVILNTPIPIINNKTLENFTDRATDALDQFGRTTNRIRESQVAKLENNFNQIISEYPYYRGPIMENVPSLSLSGSGSLKNVSNKVDNAIGSGMSSGDVFTGSLNTSHSSYLPQLKRIFKYNEGAPQFFGYKPMNPMGFLSDFNYSADDIAKYLNTEIDQQIKRGILPDNVLRPFSTNNPKLRYQSVQLPHYGIQQFKEGGVIKDDLGQWAHPGEITEINSNDITMEGVPYDVLGISDEGDVQLMKPGKNYKFKGKKVTEFPMAKNGLRQEQKSLQNLDNLTNFTNYNKPQPGGWLNKYN
jgi:hypothetical protein